MRRATRRRCRSLPYVLTVPTVMGCASATIRKVPTPTQYVHWTDDMQREADSITGIRFYLPRPFVNVFESFPVRTDVYRADGYISPDGRFVIITQVYGEGQFARPAGPSGVQLPTSALMPEPAKPGAEFQPRGAVEGAPAPQGTPAAGGGTVVTIPPTPAPPTTPPTSSGSTEKTGVNQQSSTNNNGAFAYQPLRGNFDLVYMPDFEEQYAVDSFAGLGNANIQVNLGQGWSLQGLNTLTDNSELNNRIYGLIDYSMQLAESAASAELGQVFPLLQQAAKGVTSGGAALFKPKGQPVPVTVTPDKNTPVTLKIIVLHYAAKGLYPVIKPRELEERTVKTETTYDVLDVFKMFPKVERSSDYDPTALARAQQVVDTQAGTFTVPRYPYQYISFNTFRYVAIEVVTPGSNPFQTRYPGTGTDNEGGAARTGEIISLLQQFQQIYGGGQSPPPPPPPPPPTQSPPPPPTQSPPPSSLPSTSAQHAIADAMTKMRVPPTGDQYYTISQPDFSVPHVVGARLTINGGHPADGTTEESARGQFLPLVKTAAQAQQVQVDQLNFTNLPADLTAVQAFYKAMEDRNQVRYPAPNPPGTPPSPGDGYLCINDAWLTMQPDPQGKNPPAWALNVKTQTVGAAPGVDDAKVAESFKAQANAWLASHPFTPPVTIGSVELVKPK